MRSTSPGTDDADDLIVVTGMSVWTCFGRGVDPLLGAIHSGRRELHPVLGVDTSDRWFLAKTAMQIPPPAELRSALSGQLRAVDRHRWPAALAVETALDAVLAAERPHDHYTPHRLAVCSGTSHGSNHGLLEHLSQAHRGERPDPALLADTPAIIALEIAAQLGACGPALTFNTACSAGLNAIGQAAHLLRAGRADCVIAGGHDAFSFLSFAGFTSLRALDPAGTRPFDQDRAGLSLGDGAAYLVLERAADAHRRGAPILAELRGYGCVGEGHHPTAPDPQGEGVLRAMSLALARDPAPHQLALVSAHGTGTPANDAAELTAIERLLGQLAAAGSAPQGPVAVVSLKSQTGHSLGAAGAVQAAAAIACMRADLVPGTIGLTNPIAHGARVALPAAPRPGPLPLVLCNALGFAGSVASIALRRPGSAT
ncbi:MAG: beta-ketoacyl-[acyl-carrier-protein] synthase family protein [Nannocystis sp.]|nr:beta-ketoacyl-[acyl-carrier-protein] synthase family protein [Nannocystis sp.]